MRIQCPHCEYGREMPEEQIPEGLLTVRCPKCKQRFSFSKPKEEIRVSRPEESVSRSEESIEISEPKERFSRAEESQEEAPQRPVHYTFNPWNLTPQSMGYIPAFYQTCMRVMMAPKRFFSDIESVPIKRALKFYLILSVIQIIMERIWSRLMVSYLSSAHLGNEQIQQAVSLLSSSQADILTTFGLQLILALFQIYITSFILTFSWRIITRGKEDFFVIFQVLAYAEAPCIFCLVPVIGAFIGLGLSLVLAVLGCKEALRLDWRQTILGFVPVLLLVIPTLMQFASMLPV